MSSSDKRVHFGLGAEKQVRSLEIRWPRGRVQRLDNVAADQFLKVEEQGRERLSRVTIYCDKNDAKPQP